MKKIKSYTPVAKIKNALRRIHMHDKQREIAKQRSKIDVASFKCENPECDIAVYEGTSEKRYLELADKWEKLGVKLITGRIEVDHIFSVVDVKLGFTDWNTYIHGLWVAADQYQDLCKTCHAEKSAKEAKERAEYGSLKRKGK